MKKRTRKTTSAKPKAAPLPDWLEDPPAASLQPFSKENQAELAANVELGIRDLPVWKDLVQRVGLKAAREILRRGVLMRQITDGSPRN